MVQVTNLVAGKKADNSYTIRFIKDGVTSHCYSSHSYLRQMEIAMLILTRHPWRFLWESLDIFVV